MATEDLRLRLVGTVVATNPDESRAIIVDQTTKKQLIRNEGSSVGRVVLKTILRNRVIIDAGGGEVLLTMLHDQPSGIKSAPAQAKAWTLPPSAEVTSSSLERSEIDETMPEYMDFMRTVRIRPNYQGGQPGGFMIYNIEPDSIFAKMGLENGDVIRTVNGEPIKTTQEALTFYNGLKQGNAVALEIQRGEGAQALHVDIR